eukprot:Nk52_evm5s387 gene=Nk52_evmTU5s387
MEGHFQLGLDESSANSEGEEDFWYDKTKDDSRVEASSALLCSLFAAVSEGVVTEMESFINRGLARTGKPKLKPSQPMNGGGEIFDFIITTAVMHAYGCTPSRYLKNLNNTYKRPPRVLSYERHKEIKEAVDFSPSYRELHKGTHCDPLKDINVAFDKRMSELFFLPGTSLICMDDYIDNLRNGCDELNLKYVYIAEKRAAGYELNTVTNPRMLFVVAC